MTLRILARLALLGCFAACASAPSHRAPTAAAPSASASASSAVYVDAPASSDAEVAAVARDWLQQLVARSPETASELGIHDRDAELDDRTLDGFARALAREEQLLASLRARFAERLPASRAGKTDVALMLAALSVDVRKKRDRRPLERDPTEYLAPLSALFAMTARDYAPAARRAGNALARIELLPALLATARAQVKSPPRVWTTVAIERAKGARAFFDELMPFLVGALPAEKQRIADAIAVAKKSHADYATFLEKDVLPRSTDDFAAGPELFAFLLRESLFLDESADQLRERGEAVVARTVAQMNVLAKRIDPKAKDWVDVVAALKAKHPTAAELLPVYRREVARARRFLVDRDAVPLPEPDDLQVIETPVFERNTLTASYTAAPAFDPGTRGLFAVTPVDLAAPKAKQEEMLREHDFADVVDTVVHEAYPGHHLQHAFARLHPSIVRKATSASIFAEGWGLYSEEMMAELGYFTDEERLMQLEWTLVRATRVVIDVGLHTKGMTFDDAVKMLTDVVHLERTLAVSEVKRYTMDPTQPLGYLIGREMLFRLRERYKARAGAAYTLKAFHKELLSHGTIPPGLVEAEIFAD